MAAESLEERRVLTSYIVDTLDDSTSSDGLISLREALVAANTNQPFLDAPAGSKTTDAVDRISFSPALSGQVLSLSGSSLPITDGVELFDSNPIPIILDGNGSQQIFTIDSDHLITIADVIMQNGSAPQGGAIFVAADTSLNISNATIQSSRGDNGGGIFNDGGNVTILNSTLTSNEADSANGSGGGIFSSAGNVTLISSTLSFNTAHRAGGGVEIVGGNVTALRTSFLRNEAGADFATAAPGNGGALHVSGSATVTISDGVVFGNTAAREGGGLWNQSGSTLNVIGGTLIDSNEAFGDAADTGGGGIFNNGGIVNVSGAETLISNNFASGTAGSGGGIFNAAGGELNVTQATIQANVANRAGGGIEATAGTTTKLTDVLLTENNAGAEPDAFAAPGNGGGLHITGSGDATITGGEVSFNVAAREGGGLWNGSGTMNVDGTLIVDNIASGDEAHDGGGGIFNNGGPLNLTAVTITGNTADGLAGSGGGLFSLGGPVTVTASTLSFNSANRAGGGIEIVDGDLTLTDSNLITNDVDGGAGLPAPGNGGGLHVTGNASTINVEGGSIFGNTAAREGGGLWNQSGSTLNVIGGTLIDSNEAFGDAADTGGGGIFNNGGIVNVSGAETLISNNFASGIAGSGGGIFNDAGGELNVTQATIQGNVANRAGGGIESTAGTTTNLTNVLLTENNAGVGPDSVAAPGNGGALHITGAGDATIIGGEVSFNVAAREGGGLWNGSGTMNVDGTLVVDNIASGDEAHDGGGGIFNNGGPLNLNAVTLSGNIADGISGSGGGLFSLAGPVSARNSLFDSNSANRAGGGVEIVEGSSSFFATNFRFNDVNGDAGIPLPGNGGAIHTSGDVSLAIEGGTFLQNDAAAEGGGIWTQAGTVLTLNGAAFVGNQAFGDLSTNGGGAIFNNGGTLELNNATLINNSASGASGSGGAIFNSAGSIDASLLFIGFNQASRAGGGIEDREGSFLLRDSTLTGNTAATAPGNGGGFHITGASQVEIHDSLVNLNRASSEGGGLWNSVAGTLLVAGTTVEFNSADIGGGVFNDGASGDVTIQNSTVSRNRSTTLGGGILSEGGEFVVRNSTVSSNTSESGGGITILSGTTQLESSTIAANFAALEGGGIQALAGANVSAENTLVADNLSDTAPDYSGILNSLGHNLMTDSSGAILVGVLDGNVIDTPSLLGPLVDNGGATETHLPLTGSPAIDSGSAKSLGPDQRGVIRPQGLANDIGSVEVESSGNSSALFHRADVNSDGTVTPLDALLVVNRLNSPAEGEEVKAIQDVNADGFVTPLDALVVINLLNRETLPSSRSLGSELDSREERRQEIAAASHGFYAAWISELDAPLVPEHRTDDELLDLLVEHQVRNA